MKKMIRINPEQLGSLQHEITIDGVRVLIEVSLYDLPKSVVGSFDKDSGVFSIIFGYLNQEKGQKRQVSEGIVVTESIRNGKILQIDLGLNTPKFQDISRIDLSAVAAEAIHPSENPSQDENFNRELATQILQGDQFRNMATELVTGCQ